MGNQYTFDASMLLKDAGLVAASAAATVAAVARVIDLGDARFNGNIIINATAVEVATGDERYDIVAQLSQSSTFASGIVSACTKSLGDSVPLPGDTDEGAGEYELLFTNYVNGVAYRYLRLFTVVAGTIATGINYSAWVAAIKLH